MIGHLLIHMLVPATLILDPIRFDSHRLWMLLPLTLIIAVVYKATKVEDVRQLPVASLLLWLTIVGAMLGVGAGLYVITLLFL